MELVENILEKLSENHKLIERHKNLIAMMNEIVQEIEQENQMHIRKLYCSEAWNGERDYP